MKYEWRSTRVRCLDDQGQRIGEIGWHMIDDDQTYVIERTWVDPNHRGTAIAAEMTKKLLDKITTENKKFIPLCSFTEHFLDKEPQYRKAAYYPHDEEEF
ncbi:MAG TPA: N-acetyltransferase [Candidatus Ligilactobacillus avistercoris]|nr:N-acetyltransferase [Candidatus Ligilactobacillus avistercoris]